MLIEVINSLVLIADQTRNNLWILSYILLLLWGIFIINLAVGKRLLYLGIRPRQLSGLPGIFMAPFLHANFNHLFFNSIPLIVFANFILIQGVPLFFHVTVLIIILSGLLVWCFASAGLHVGASGVITGYWGYLLAKAYFQNTATNLIFAGVCLFYFAGILYSIFPGKRHVSWQGHLYGLLAGISAAYF